MTKTYLHIQQQWTLRVVRNFPTQETILYHDPLGELDEKKNNILQSQKTIINRRFSSVLESSGPSKWKAETVKHRKLLDSVSCGLCYESRQNIPSVAIFNIAMCNHQQNIVINFSSYKIDSEIQTAIFLQISRNEIKYGLEY